MWWTDWAKTLGSGFLGSVIGFLGIAWTLRSNRRWEIEREDTKQRQAQREKLAEKVSDFIEVLTSIDNEYKENPEEVRKFRAQIGSLTAYLGAEYPNTAVWCMYHSRDALRSLTNDDFDGFLASSGKLIFHFPIWLRHNPFDDEYFPSLPGWDEVQDDLNRNTPS